MAASAIGAAGTILDEYGHKVEREVNKELGKTEFLELLVAQLNNQNPLDPQDNGEFVAQLAQFSTLEGIEKLNDSMGNILDGVHSSQALQASSLVGRKVILASEQAMVDTAETFKGSVLVPQSSSNVYVSVYDDAGNVVSRINMGAQEAGNQSFMWDGKDSEGEQLPPGKYRFKAEGSFNGKTEGLYTMLPANVDSVTLSPQGGEMLLNLAGLGPVPLSQVQIIGQ
ncbi:MAG: flagellar hook assembly protein FlgD [Gammaproteobacteria bacterium]|jgi:flagellar basal-body rod modification protein FlgD|nr:flagellar hook assembly protein FlgD [Gammaproteobacteria bacterium]